MRNWNDNSKITFIWLSVCLWLGGTGARAQHCHRSLRRLGSSLDTESERLCLPLPLKDATAPPPPLPRPPTSINYSPLSPPILPLHCSSCPNKINTFFLICFRRFQFFLSRLEWQPLLFLAFSFWLNFKHKCWNVIPFLCLVLNTRRKLCYVFFITSTAGKWLYVPLLMLPNSL